MTDVNGNIGNTDQQEVIEEGMQGATGNVDASGLDQNLTEEQREEKLEELTDNLSNLGRS